MISAGMATMRDLDEHLSVEDVYDLIEIVTVDAHNRRIISKTQ